MVDSTPFVRTDRYENSFYPYTIKAWKNLENEAKLKPSAQSFKKHLNDFIRPTGHSYMKYVINTGSNYSLKSELLFRTYVTIGLIVISTAKIRNARVVWKMKPRNTFSFTVRIILLNVPHLAKYQQLLALM